MEDLLPKTGYRARIMNAVKHDKNHPVNNGVKMQAHHLVSAKGVQLAGMGNDLKQLGYNINVLENLVLLPSTLDAACHMRVQLHRGDHNDADDEHPLAYHERVKIELAKLEKFMDSCKGCSSQAQMDENRKRVQSKLDQKSKVILILIEKFQVKLSRIGKDFRHGDIGCAGRENVGDNPLGSCPHDRDHFLSEASGLKNGVPKEYSLRTGK